MTALIAHIDDPRRTALVRQARLHFVSEGYVGTRMEPIAREAGVSTATLYAMFENKAALFAAVIDEAATDFSTRMSAVKNYAGAPRERLQGFLTTYAEFMSDAFVQAIFRLVMAERSRFEDIAIGFFDKAKRDFGALLIKALNDMQTDGELKFEKASWAAGQLMGMVEHPIFFVPMVTGGQVIAQRTPADIAADAVETFLARYQA
ncbi:MULTISPECIES: TetR/AcrR family transcriptional regulator [Brevundimonas]|uniref:TetR/AcrR family transcriptional regulator n=1 Tax=Brevundimonas sp. 357 TaxID=2555782 RepID=UPI000F7B51C2|nr:MULTISPECIES: TetR/AcrR family transcriptional regulator [Brevundimonas]RSB47760.1 TetR/AcrR family transcriptional regulator [Brevundimonas sp. 357]